MDARNPSSTERARQAVKHGLLRPLLMSLFVAGLVVGAVVFYGTFRFGVVTGQEFSPGSFTRRQFHYLEVPLLQILVTPISRDDCTGPVVLAASTHLSLAAPNALIQESVRAYYRTWYRDVVTALSPVEAGMISVPEGPGLGLDLNPDLDRTFTVTRTSSRLNDL